MDGIFGSSTPARESTLPLGRVITGEHAHAGVRHTHDRLSDDHDHCVRCGGDFRLCLQNRLHAPGASPARESDAQGGPNPFADAVNGMFDGRRSPITTGRAMAIQWQQEQAQPGQAQNLAAAWERACGGSGPTGR